MRGHNGNQFSIDAYVALLPTLRASERLFLSAVLAKPEGITAKEVAVAVGREFNTISGRRKALIRAGLIVCTGIKRDGSEVLRPAPAQMRLLEVA